MKSKRLFYLLLSSLLILVSGIVIFGFSHSETDKKPVEKKSTDATAVVVQREFGLPLDSFYVIHDKIRQNQFLASILSPYQISPQTLASLAVKSKDIFDIRNLKAGDQYTLFCTNDSLRKACYFVYQPNAIDYIIYDLRDSLNIYKKARPVTIAEKEAGGTINGSLFETLSDINADPELAMKLAKIYAWDIDFYSIHKGDRFKIIYDQSYVNNEPVGTGRIKAALFVHDDEPYYAFYYHNDSTGTDGYYNEQAKSLHKAFLKAPLKFFHISSRYSRHRFHPVQHRWKAHLGTDYAAPTGTPIMATAAGTIIASQYSQFNGNYVKIKHNSTYTTQYLHMSRRAVRVGQHVSQGQVIGYVGSTGLATGPHVCYRFWKNGTQVDPLKQKFPAAEPIDNQNLPAFNQLVQKEMAQLNVSKTDTSAPIASLP